MKIQASQRLRANNTLEKLMEIFRTGSPREVLEFIMKEVSKMGTDQLAREMGRKGTPRVLFPSGWAYEFPNREYPGFLAAALVKSASEESLSDITNVYYSSGRKLSPQAYKIFLQSVLRQSPAELSTFFMDMDDPMEFSGLEGWARAKKSDFAKLVSKLPNVFDA